LPHYSELLETHEFVRLLYIPHTERATLITADSLSVDQDPATIKLQAPPKFHRHRREWSQTLYRWCLKHPRQVPLANTLLYHLFFSSKVCKVGNLYDSTVTKSRGSTLELAEWTIPLFGFPDLWNEFEALLAQRPLVTGVHIPMDIRFIRQDSAWLSNANQGDTVTVGCVSRLAEYANQYTAFDVVEELFLRRGGRPHWAKHFNATAKELAPGYPKWIDFLELRSALDPQGKFLNSYLARLFGLSESSNL
jgi:hypothetical protein